MSQCPSSALNLSSPPAFSPASSPTPPCHSRIARPCHSRTAWQPGHVSSSGSATCALRGSPARQAAASAASSRTPPWHGPATRALRGSPAMSEQWPAQLAAALRPATCALAGSPARSAAGSSASSCTPPRRLRIAWQPGSRGKQRPAQAAAALCPATHHRTLVTNHHDARPSNVSCSCGQQNLTPEASSVVRHGQASSVFNLASHQSPSIINRQLIVLRVLLPLACAACAACTAGFAAGAACAAGFPA